MMTHSDWAGLLEADIRTPDKDFFVTLGAYCDWADENEDVLTEGLRAVWENHKRPWYTGTGRCYFVLTRNCQNCIYPSWLPKWMNEFLTGETDEYRVIYESVADAVLDLARAYGRVSEGGASVPG